MCYIPNCREFNSEQKSYGKLTQLERRFWSYFEKSAIRREENGRRTPSWIWQTCPTCPTFPIRILTRATWVTSVPNFSSSLSKNNKNKKSFHFLPLGWATRADYWDAEENAKSKEPGRVVVRRREGAFLVLSLTISSAQTRYKKLKDMFWKAANCYTK